MKSSLVRSVAALAAAVVFGLSAATVLAAGSARVWVRFSPGQKAPVMAALKAAGGNIHYEFDRLDAVAVTLPEAALTGIAHNPNVVLVEEDPVRMLYGQQTPYGVTMVQAPALWSTTPSAVLGGGVTVGVIDTGVYTNHEDLAGQTINGEASGTGAWDHDGAGHGTHVVGTILAANNSLGVVGVAPAASVYMVKVFDDNGTWTYSSTLVYAVDRARAHGAKIISMSLGGKVKSLTEQRAFDSDYQAGTLLIAAAGNDGNSTYSYPASYSSVISVAAIDQSTNRASFSQYNNQVELAAPGVGVLSTVPYKDASLTVNNESYIASAIQYSASTTTNGTLVNGGFADATTSTSGWQGNVVLVARGGNSFYDKVSRVQNGGGIAAVIYNNVPGGFSGTLGSGNSSTIPAIGITQEDGQALVTALGNGSTLQATVSTIYEAPASGYAHYDGTSMATPHVSGVAALLWSAFPAKSNVEIRTAMQATALDLGAAGRDNYYGYGLVQAKAAYDYLAAGGGGGGSDTKPPVISSINAAKVNARKFKITWTTDEPATSAVTFTGGVGKSASNSTLVTAHSMTFSGTLGTTYVYTVRSTDAAGNTATSAPQSYLFE